MHQNPNYTLIRLDNAAYLMPSGQMVADYRRSMKLNDSAAAIWQELEMAMSRSRLISILAGKFGIADNALPAFTDDINQFIDRLISGHYICPDFLDSMDDDFSTTLSIAGLTIRLHGSKEAVSPHFAPFIQPKKTAFPCDQDIAVLEEEMPDHNGYCILEEFYLTLYEEADRYILEFPFSGHLQGCLLSKNGKNACFYITPPCTPQLQEDLFQTIRTVFLYLAGKKGMVAIHSSSILYDHQAWLFSGPSGTGKSTHAGLWTQTVHTPVINGDLNLLALDVETGPVIHGIPWCGTSGICDNLTHPLGGIVLLRQDSTNKIYPMTTDEALLRIIQRIISPRWDNQMLSAITESVRRLYPHIRVFRLGCTISPEAVAVIRAEIDR